MSAAAPPGLPPDGALLTRLRPATDDEASLLAAWRSEASSPFEDWGEPEGERRQEPAVVGRLVVTDADDQPIGTVSWHCVTYGPTLNSRAMDIGISLRPDARGLGHGSRAQRMLARYLFTTTSVNRVQASTDVTNLAEQRALERAGFRREGVLRGAQWRQGQWHDLVTYALLREDG